MGQIIHLYFSVAIPIRSFLTALQQNLQAKWRQYKTYGLSFKTASETNSVVLSMYYRKKESRRKSLLDQTDTAELVYNGFLDVSLRHSPVSNDVNDDEQVLRYRGAQSTSHSPYSSHSLSNCITQLPLSGKVVAVSQLHHYHYSNYITSQF